MAILPELSECVFDFALPGGLTIIRRDYPGPDEFGEDSAPITQPIHIDPIVIYPLESDRVLGTNSVSSRHRVEGFTLQYLRIDREGESGAADVIQWDPNCSGELWEYIVEECEPWVTVNGAWRFEAVRKESR